MAGSYLINFNFLEVEPVIGLNNVEEYFRTFETEYDLDCINERVRNNPHLPDHQRLHGVRFDFELVDDKYILIKKCQVIDGNPRFVLKHYIVLGSEIYIGSSLKDVLLNRVQNITGLIRDIHKHIAELDDDETSLAV